MIKHNNIIIDTIKTYFVFEACLFLINNTDNPLNIAAVLICAKKVRSIDLAVEIKFIDIFGLLFIYITN